jgi:hypothetical protein
MKKSRYSPEQVAFGLRQAENGTPVPEVCRRMGISEQTLRLCSGQAFLSLEEEISGCGRGRGAPAAGPGKGKPQAEAIGGRPEPG